MGKLRALIVAVALMALSGCPKDVCSENKKLMFRQPTAVLAKPYPEWYKKANNEVVTTMQPGQTLSICSFTPSKDFAIYKVKLPNGKVGYVEYDPARVREVSNTQATPSH
jgi:hypothetical protein